MDIKLITAGATILGTIFAGMQLINSNDSKHVSISRNPAVIQTSTVITNNRDTATSDSNVHISKINPIKQIPLELELQLVQFPEFTPVRSTPKRTFYFIPTLDH